MRELNKGLSQIEIADLDKAIFELFKLHRKLRSEMPIAERIKFPQIPSVFSESMVVLAANNLFNLEDSWDAFRGGRICDVLLQDKSSNQQRVEVKATSRKETLEIKERDIKSDWLVWIAFGPRFYDGFGSIIIYVLRYPYKYLDPSDAGNRITNLSKFLGKVGKNKNLSKFEFNSLEEFFDFAVPPNELTQVVRRTA